MKTDNYIRLIVIICFIIILPANADQRSNPNKGKTPTSSAPVAVAKEARFDFEPVIEGTDVVHEFVIENKGNSPLHIEKVRTSCGCTTADYTKVIQPQAEGEITIKGNTKGYGGRKFSKTITVYTNDPVQKEMKLYLSGEVERFALIEPRRVFLQGVVGSKLQSVVTIIPEKKYPFNIVDSYSNNLEDKIEFTLIRKAERYFLTVNNLMENPGKYRGIIHLKTDSTVHPEIIIYVSGVITQKKS